MSKFCGNCGSMAADEARVCGNCGTPFEMPQNNFAQPQNNFAEPQNNFAQPQYQQSFYQPLTTVPAPVPKKSKKGLIIGAVIAVIAIIAAVAIAVSSGGGSSSKGDKEEKKNTAESVASQAASYLVKGDADALVDYTSDDFIKFAEDQYGYDKAGVKEILKEQYENYTEEIEDMKSDGYKVTYELLDYEESDEFEEIQTDIGDNITDVYIYEMEICFEDDEGYTDEDDIAIMVWKNDGKWEFVAINT